MWERRRRSVLQSMALFMMGVVDGLAPGLSSISEVQGVDSGTPAKIDSLAQKCFSILVSSWVIKILGFSVRVDYRFVFIGEV